MGALDHHTTMVAPELPPPRPPPLGRSGDAPERCQVAVVAHDDRGLNDAGALPQLRKVCGVDSRRDRRPRIGIEQLEHRPDIRMRPWRLARAGSVSGRVGTRAAPGARKRSVSDILKYRQILRRFAMLGIERPARYRLNCWRLILVPRQTAAMLASRLHRRARLNAKFAADDSATAAIPPAPAAILASRHRFASIAYFWWYNRMAIALIEINHMLVLNNCCLCIRCITTLYNDHGAPCLFCVD